MLASKIKEIRNGRVIVKDSKMKDVEPSSEQIGKIVGLVMSSEKDPTRAIAMIQNKISSEFHLSMEEREKLLPQIKMAISVYNNSSKDSKMKDKAIEIRQGLLYDYDMKDKIINQFPGKVEFSHKGDGLFGITRLDESVRGKQIAVSDSKTKDAWKIGEPIKYFINGQANYGRIIDYDDSTNDGSVIYHVVSNKNPDKDYFITMNKEHSRQMSIHD